MGTAVAVVAVVGGLAQEKQLRLLQEHPDVVVATPGRLAELLGAPPACLAQLHKLFSFPGDGRGGQAGGEGVL